MKNFLAKLRISSCLDEDQPLPPGLKDRIDKSPELHTFVRRTKDLHERLAHSHPPHPYYLGLRESVRMAVRSSHAKRQAGASVTFGRLVAACGLASVVLLGGWIGLRFELHSRDARLAEHQMPSAAAVLDQGERVALSASDTVLAPLTEEWHRLNLDLQKTADYLLASLP